MSTTFTREYFGYFGRGVIICSKQNSTETLDVLRDLSEYYYERNVKVAIICNDDETMRGMQRKILSHAIYDTTTDLHATKNR
jgi:hypothetical protein